MDLPHVATAVVAGQTVVEAASPRHQTSINEVPGFSHLWVRPDTTGLTLGGCSLTSCPGRKTRVPHLSLSLDSDLFIVTFLFLAGGCMVVSTDGVGPLESLWVQR